MRRRPAGTTNPGRPLRGHRAALAAVALLTGAFLAAVFPAGTLAAGPLPAAPPSPSGAPVNDSPPPPPPPLPSAPASAIPPPDTLPREARAFPPGELDAYRADPAFAYARSRTEQPTLWQRLWSWFGDTFLRPIARSGEDLWTPLLLTAFTLLLGWGVLRALLADGSGLFAPRDPAAPGGAGAVLLDVDDIAAVDLAARLRAARAAGDLREASRLRYLLLLQRLDARGDIAWRRGATNRDYVLQVRAARPGAFARDFAAATRAFAFVWYGGAPLDAARHARLDARLDALERAAQQASTRSAGTPA